MNFSEFATVLSAVMRHNDRLLHLDVEADANAWAKWASARGIDPMVIAYKRYRASEYHHTFLPTDNAYPTPLPWMDNGTRILKGAVFGEACVKAKGRGYPHESWTLRLLAAHAREHGPLPGHACLAELAPSTVHEVLNSQPVKPHRVRYYLQRRDLAFEERKAEVLEVYAAAEMLRYMP
jgi:hypothetical protein